MSYMVPGFSRSKVLKGNEALFVAAILVFICIALLFVYLLGMRLYSPPSPAVFWMLIVTAIGLIIFQILRVPWDGYEPVLLIEISMLGIALHLVHIIPFYGMPTTDSLRILAIAGETVKYGVVTPDRPATVSVAAWPLLPIWGAELHYITGIIQRNIAMWFPSFTNGVFALLLYIFIKKVFKSSQVALMTMLLMVTLLYFIRSGTSFKPEEFALVMMMAGLTFLTAAQGHNRTKFAVLSLLFLAGAVFSHHATPFLFLLFLITYLAVSRILNVLGNRWLLPPKEPTLIVSGTFTLLVLVAVFSYWIYINEVFLEGLTMMVQTLLYGGSGESLVESSYVVSPEIIITIRGQVQFWGYYSFHAVFAIILLLGLLSRHRKQSPEFYSSTIFLFIFGAWALIQASYIPVGTPMVTGVERLMMLGWIWGFAPLAICVLENNQRRVKQAGIVILGMFMLFNVYMLPQMNWDFKTPGRAEGAIVLREDYALAEIVPFSGEVGSFKFTRNAIYDVQGYYASDFRQVDFTRLEDLDSIVIKKGELESYMGGYYRLTGVGRSFDYTIAQLNQLQELLAGSSPDDRNRIYDSTNVVVLR